MDLNAFTTQFVREHDACGIFSRIEKTGVPSHKTVRAGVEALKALRHRAGYVLNEGDGCGLLLDIPRPLWRRWLAEPGRADAVDDARFFVAHLLVQRASFDDAMAAVRQQLADAGCNILMERIDQVDGDALGPLARRENPVFVQVAGLAPEPSDAPLYRLAVALEKRAGVHVASISRTVVVYKVVGDGDTLWRFYPDLRDPDCVSVFVLAHTRYSTNTATSFSRVQPFNLLGHNGEINTITRFFAEAGMIGVDLDPGFSDSQMVNGALHALTAERGWTLFEAAELFFPPIINEIKQMAPELSDMYMFLRSLWGPFSQGPAAIMMRFGNEAVYSVDALGLRPMWLVETKDAYCFSSEQGIVPADLWVADPKPLSPGEKIGVVMEPNGVRLYSYPELQRVVLERISQRFQFAGEGKNIHFAGPFSEQREVVAHPERDHKPLAIRAAAFGWREDDYKMLEFEAQTGAEPIRSLGYDGPLAALDPSLRLLSDFLQETVAVVTNPAIDREREIEHFSTRTVLGRRPSISGLYKEAPRIELQSPLLFEELPEETGISREDIQALAHRHGTLCLEDALAALHTSPYGTVEILIHREGGESVEHALERFRREALEAVQAGANVIVLDDRLTFIRGAHVDPFLAVAAVHKALQRPASSQGGEHLRRRTSLVLRSGGLRNLHDIMVAIGLGADAVVPYLMWEVAASKGSIQAVENLYSALCKGIEKVISTIGIHELRGYERLFSAIGLANPIADILGVPNFCGADQVGYGFSDMEREAHERQEIYDTPEERKLKRQRSYHLYPRIWKVAGDVAQGTAAYDTFAQKLHELERENPINLRHLLDIRFPDQSRVEPEAVDTSVDIHQYPIVISSMSFGSQNEIAYRAYAEAAYRLNIVGLNGEGGEIKDLLTRYPRNRGRQVASGRFGVNAELCNGAYVLEIKIGQGAKPGEGGHLPGSKVTVKVAQARNATPGTDLISPSNNHDIYSIEDLAQVIYELREINPLAKIAVKVPVVPNIGTISVGIVKAGADIVNLSGFDGGTGAARAHALRHVGLPMEIGVKLAHDALCEAGLRDYAEIWADGGMKSGLDVMKAILLGANRVGFGTMAMVAIGCTSCRACHKDTCHVGIATQMEHKEEAIAKGLKVFELREFDLAVEHLVRFFGSIGEDVRRLTARLGATRTQDLVGRRDLLEQLLGLDRVDLSWLTQYEQRYIGRGTRIVYRTFEEEQAAETAVAATLAMAVGTDVAGPVAVDPGLQLVQGAAGVTGEPVEVRGVPRALGTRDSGERVRKGVQGDERVVHVYRHVAGNGFAAYHTAGMYSIAHGGAQDGVGKGAFGGKIVVLKHKGPDGIWRGGSVGKGLAYGAQRGLFIIQGNADARAGIRLSGADVVIGGEVEGHLDDSLGWIGARSNVKGFAFEYMTAGRAVVLGDPGPWICSGMTGGSVYLRHDPSVGLTEKALRRRIAKGAKVSLTMLDEQGVRDVQELLDAYQKELRRSGQNEAADKLQPLIDDPAQHFLMVRPGEGITDQDIATE
ncbi:glutamate synthase [Alicyclobacillus cellulosilyticus]|uniref:Glutamate synthase n=1 Tax=Alicyclobacillus cellulosilyticus TaxID=1003997 RepID=A0A917K953_9BACL|nr:glutamate synthase-related protein [Alicyclobacillus cellulosilyticus]GGJ03228.1 glutamate synthase [Alicyclobacillus cellulosilyticus]